MRYAMYIKVLSIAVVYLISLRSCKVFRSAESGVSIDHHLVAADVLTFSNIGAYAYQPNEKFNVEAFWKSPFITALSHSSTH